ncbi:hypothetical protein EI94DRAFT_1787898 [Lactarius quietus]|nr:hypothetical protein EI94DRAFT_1787898 [Lactarius quietus]
MHYKRISALSIRATALRANHTLCSPGKLDSVNRPPSGTTINLRPALIPHEDASTEPAPVQGAGSTYGKFAGTKSKTGEIALPGSKMWWASHCCIGCHGSLGDNREVDAARPAQLAPRLESYPCAKPFGAGIGTTYSSDKVSEKTTRKLARTIQYNIAVGMTERASTSFRRAGDSNSPTNTAADASEKSAYRVRWERVQYSNSHVARYQNQAADAIQYQKKNDLLLPQLRSILRMSNLRQMGRVLKQTGEAGQEDGTPSQLFKLFIRRREQAIIMYSMYPGGAKLSAGLPEKRDHNKSAHEPGSGCNPKPSHAGTLTKAS